MNNKSNFIFRSLVIFGLISSAGCSLIDKTFKEEPFVCNGSLKTMFFEAPLNLRINENKFTLKTNIKDSLNKESAKLLDDLDIPIPEFNNTYELNVQYADGVYIEPLDNNKYSFKHFFVNGTIFIDRCVLEYPIEIDSTKNLLEYGNLLKYFLEY